VLSRTPFPTSLQHPSAASSSSLLSSQSSHSNSSNKSNHDLGGSGGSSTTRTSASSHVNKLVESVSKLGDKLRGTDASSSSIESETPPGQQSAPSSKKKKNRSVWDVLSDQDTFISGIMDVQLSYLSKAKQIAKETHIRSVLAKEGYGPNPSRISFPMPCAPEIMVNSVIPEKTKVFKSAVYPALIEFNVEHVVDKNCFTSQQITMKGPNATTKQGTSTRGGGRSSSSDLSTGTTTETKIPQLKSYRVLMKTGDDLRQDQLVMMMMKLMDRLLKRASLDLCITPYSIIATSPSSGIVEFVEQSMPLSAVLANHNNSILQFFRSCAPQKGAKYDVRPDVISSYVRSVAGTYSVF
jgi:phosphatidylinositol 3-kinase